MEVVIMVTKRAYELWSKALENKPLWIVILALALSVTGNGVLISNFIDEQQPKIEVGEITTKPQIVHKIEPCECEVTCVVEDVNCVIDHIDSTRQHEKDVHDIRG
jgi:hypothetical protein